MDKKMNVFIKTVHPPYARFEADYATYSGDLITFMLDDEIVAQATIDNIEYWYAKELSEDDD